MPSWVTDGCRTYAKRMPPGATLELIEVKAEARNGGKTVAQMLAAESLRIRAALPKGARMIALDEHGKDLSTCGFAVQLEAWMQERGALAFVIGGSDGLDGALKKSATLLLRLSSLTLPHGLARVLLAEQLYRAFSIIGGHPYHRE